MRIILASILLVPLLGAAVIYGLFVVWGSDLPSPQTLRELEPSMNTVILDRNGLVIDEFFLENRSPRPLPQIPPLVQAAVLATEDVRFGQHWGIDVVGVLRAAFTNLTSGTIEQGASTITQQLARKLFLTDSQTWNRKLKEAVLAIRLERSFSKDEILELYLNKVYFGEGAYGVEAAAQTYFGKSSDQLALEEIATLAGVLANPSAFNPVRKPENSKRRRNLVLRRMLQAGVVDTTAYGLAEAADLVLNTSGKKSASRAPYFTEAVRQELADRYGDTHVYTGGLTVHTTLDLALQESAVAALESQLQTLEEMQAHRYKYLKDPATRAGSLAHPEEGTPYLQGAAVAIEPQTGAIRMLVGGRHFAESKFNRAFQAVRQPGSAFKPILFAAAVREGHSPNDILYDTPVQFPGPGGAGSTPWEPKNFDLEFRGPVTMRYALMKSLNIPAVRLMDEVTPRKVIALAKEMGIERNLPPYLSLALGTGEVTPLEITAAYAIFANQGIYSEPYMIERVEDRYGNLVELHLPKSREVIDERTNAIMVSMLQSVIDGGTGAPARSVHGFHAPAGGKTGTTDDYSDAWFVGFVPRLACGVWVGFDEKKTIGSRMTGTAAALPAWSAIMKKAVKELGAEEFSAPRGLIRVTTCRDTGLLALPDCPKVSDLYRPGHQPTRSCPIHAQYLAPSFDEEEEWSPRIRSDEGREDTTP